MGVVNPHRKLGVRQSKYGSTKSVIRAMNPLIGLMVIRNAVAITGNIINVIVIMKSIIGALNSLRICTSNYGLGYLSHNGHPMIHCPIAPNIIGTIISAHSEVMQKKMSWATLLCWTSSGP
jgi:hypothetical protein